MSIWDAWAADPRYAQVVNDPRFLSATPAFRQSIHDVLYKYGFTATPGQSSLMGGMPVEANPYSVAATLKKNYTNADHSSMNAANAANLEESGAAAGALHANAEDYKQNVSTAVANEGSEISGALTGYNNTIGNIFGDVEAKTAQTPVGPVSSQGLTASSPIPQVYAPIGTSTPTTVHDEGPGAYAQSQAIPVAQKLKKTTLPKPMKRPL